MDQFIPKNSMETSARVYGTGSGHGGSFLETQTSGFVEGIPDSSWVRGLEERDCKKLLQLLERSPSSWVETSREGRNVLHVAIIQGCTQLVKQVLKLARQGSSQSFVDDDSFSNNLPSLKTLLNAMDGRCKVDVFCLASIVGNQDVIQILDKTTHTIQDAYTAQNQKVERQAQDYKAESQANDDDNIGSVCLHCLMQNALELRRNARFKSIIEKDVDYNFEDPKRKELLVFHCACKRAHLSRSFICDVVEMARAQGVLQELFQLKDAQGRTPLHVAVDFGRATTQALLDLLPKEAEFADCINALDGAGRTPLHRAVANNLGFSYSRLAEILVNDIRTDVNAEWRDGMTALHLAILHNDPGTAELLLAAKGADGSKRVDVAKTITRDISVYKTTATSWTALELATVMGISAVVQAFVSQDYNHELVYDRCLHLAAAAGDLRSVQLFLGNPRVNRTHFAFEKHSVLHFAVHARLPYLRQLKAASPLMKVIDVTLSRFLCFSDMASIHWLEQKLIRLERPKQGGYGAKQGCINLLLQSGADIWEMDAIDGNIADPGMNATDEAQLWWYEKFATETREAKNNFNAAGNATAVVAGLVATASFVGPLQPPLGYGSDAANVLTFDLVQATKLSMKLFTVSNSLSFYLAIASIMLAIMPSLPMPREGLRDEVQRSRRTIVLAISTLLLSIISILISFASSSVAVTPHYFSLPSKGLTFYPILLGGSICLVVIFFFFLRLLRLVFTRNLKIKRFYQTYGKF